MYFNIKIFFPCIPKNTNFNKNSEIIYYNNNQDHLLDFNNKRKISKYLKQYCIYLFSHIGEKDINDFFTNHTIIQNNDHKYVIDVEPYLSLNNSYIQNNKLILTSDTLKKRLKYMLEILTKRNEQFISNYKNREIMYNYFENILESR